jgi:hypothetical protein
MYTLDIFLLYFFGGSRLLQLKYLNSFIFFMSRGRFLHDIQGYPTLLHIHCKKTLNANALYAHEYKKSLILLHNWV